MKILDRLLESAKGINSLEEWETYIEDYTKRLNEQAKKQEKETEGVLISTMHGVKGLEFDRVYILNVNEGSIPYKKAVLEPALEEERRLFYVGMTRAKEKTHVMLCETAVRKGQRTVQILKEAGV